MRSISLSLILFGAAITASAVAGTACESPLDVPAASDANTIDTVTLYALRGTSLLQPSAYDIVGRTVAHTDRLEAFDFAVDLTDNGGGLVYPAGALGLTKNPGLLRMPSAAFDTISAAPLTGFVLDSVLAVSVGDVFVGKSRPNGLNCALAGSLPRYGKFRVLGIDAVARTITFQVLVDANCGYRGLQPGIPKS